MTRRIRLLDQGGRSDRIPTAGRLSPSLASPETAPRDPARIGRRGTDRADAQEPDADPYAVARLICLRLLTAAPRTRAQLAVALARRKVPESVGASVLDRLTEVGLVDDGEYARAWVESRHAGRGLGRRALAAELHDRGVAAEHVEGAVDQLDAATEEATARALVRRRLPSVGGLSPAARQRRLLGLLARKGYAPGLAFRVVREAVSAVDDDGAEEIPFEGDLGEEGGLGVDQE